MQLPNANISLQHRAEFLKVERSVTIEQANQFTVDLYITLLNKNINPASYVQGINEFKDYDAGDRQ